MAKVICISSQKGGVGKTTSTHNIGVELANRKNKVLLVDLDPSGNLTTSLGFERGAFENTVCNFFEEDLEDAVPYETGTENLSLIPSTPKLVMMRTKLMQAYHREDKLNVGLEALRPFYDYILIDTSPGMDLLIINAFVATDYLVIPTEASLDAKEGVDDSLSFYNTCRTQGLNEKIKYLGLLVNRYRVEEIEEVEVLDYLEKNYTVLSVVNTSADKNKGRKEGKSAIEVRPKGVVGKAYNKATTRIINLIKEDENNG